MSFFANRIKHVLNRYNKLLTSVDFLNLMTLSARVPRVQNLFFTLWFIVPTDHLNLQLKASSPDRNTALYNNIDKSTVFHLFVSALFPDKVFGFNGNLLTAEKTNTYTRGGRIGLIAKLPTLIYRNMHLLLHKHLYL